MGLKQLIALSSSYARGTTAGVVARGAVAAIQIGAQVRRAPILRPDPALLARPEELVPACTLVSDTHVLAPGRVPCELEHDPAHWPLAALPTADDIAARLRGVLAHVAQHAPPTVIWCGDEVDSGDPAEWAAWRAIAEGEPTLAHRVVPGNHDICFNRPFDADYTLARRAIRERAFQDHAGRLADFPVVDTIVTDAGAATLVLLDSCRHRSTHILSNAVGRFGADQLGELARILAHVRGPVLCVAHHHIWRDERFLQPEAWYNTTVDADALTAILGAYRRRDARNQVLVCHGHRHCITSGWVGDADAPIGVVGLPSTTLGDKSNGGVLDMVPRYSVAGLRVDGTWGVAVTRVAGAA